MNFLPIHALIVLFPSHYTLQKNESPPVELFPLSTSWSAWQNHLPNKSRLQRAKHPLFRDACEGNTTGWFPPVRLHIPEWMPVNSVTSSEVLKTIGLFNTNPMLPFRSCSTIKITEREKYFPSRKGSAIKILPISTFLRFLLILNKS